MGEHAVTEICSNIRKGPQAHMCLGPISYVAALSGNVKIKVLIALVGQLSQSVVPENDPEWGLQTVSFNP